MASEETFDRVPDYAIFADTTPGWTPVGAGGKSPTPIGHTQLHPSDQLWKSRHTNLTPITEREAEDFVRELLIDIKEATEELLAGVGEVAEHFRVQTEKVARFSRR